MRPPTISPPPDDRPTAPLRPVALAQPAPVNPGRSAVASTPPYWPAAGGPTVYRPESSYSVTAGTARPAQPPGPPHRGHTAPPRRWPWVTGGVAVLVVIIALTHNPATSTPPTATIGDPGTTAPAPTQSSTTPTNTAIPAPSTGRPAPAIVAPALPRTTPPHTVARVAPTPRAVGPALTTTPRPIPVAASTTAAQPPKPVTASGPGANVAEAPPPALPTPLVQTPLPSTQPTYYTNCAAVRAAGAAPLHRGDPGYRPGLDRDGDGIACE